MLSSSHIQTIIAAVNKTLNELKQWHISKPETLLKNIKLNSNVNFPLNQKESELLEALTETIASTVMDVLQKINDESKSYLCDMLYEYHYDRSTNTFTESLTMNSLLTLVNDLESMEASLEAFPAAWNGKKDLVAKFINKYPHYKDKSGPNGTTLLYSAARRNHLDLVKYLVEEANCSINAQNEQHIEMVLMGHGESASDFSYNPRAGSTALHAACFYGYLRVVEYLVEHGADYYLKNHKGETAISNALEELPIKEYFEKYLILGYLKETGPLPVTPIIEGGQALIDDCVWEFKRFQDSRWYPFSTDERNILSKSLRISHNEEFQLEIHLKVSRGIYGVSIPKFLRSGKDLNFDQNLAWIRCRGSSIANFDCYSRWQIMIDGDKAPSSMQPLEFPSLSKSNFTLEENTWYNCPEQMNSQIDKAMNYRRKHFTLKFPFISDQLKVNLQVFTFSFTKNRKTISGFLRWIPKIVSINEHAANKITYLDNFMPMADLKPILMTSKHQRKLMTLDDMSLHNLGEHEMTDDVDDEKTDFNNYSTPIDDATGYAMNFANKAMHEESYDITSRNECMSSIDFDDSNENLIQRSPAIEIRTRVSSNQPSTANNSVSSESASSVNDADAVRSKLLEANGTIEKLQDEKELLEDEIQKYMKSNHEKDKQYTKELSKLHKQLDRLAKEREAIEKEQLRLKKEQDRVKEIKAEIKTVDYKNVQSEIVDNCLSPYHNLLIKTLKNVSTVRSTQLVDTPVQVIFDKYQTSYSITVTAFPDEHMQFTTILQRIKSVIIGIQSAKNYYQRVLKRMIQSLMVTFSKVRSKSHYWSLFKKTFSQSILEKSKEYITMFNKFTDEKLRKLNEQCITGEITKPGIKIRSLTNQFIDDNQFMNEVERTKHHTLKQLIRENFSLEKTKLSKKPTEKSRKTIENLLRKITEIFQTRQEYKGYELKHLQKIPDLLQQAMIYYCCFKLQLPLFDSAEDLLGKIETNTVTTITTTTGSGKSTLLPALLIAEGYEKVIVTQPRRLPCQSISKRVNETMTIDTYVKQEHIAGWMVSGIQKNPGAKILYMTDGFLRERLLYDDSIMPINRPVKRPMVIFLDEVHERSINIDLCLAFLARLLTIYPQLESKLKIIISSATLDASVPRLFRSIPQMSIDEFALPQLGTNYTVTKYSRPNANILDIVRELYKKCKLNDQILCFVNSALEAVENCKLLSDISGNTINARPLIQAQSTVVQEENIAQATVLFSTTIAETSLTFPSLKYVVDTGYINLPMYDPQSQRTVLTTIRAAHSTIKQRLGRVGRTQPGEYYALYDYNPEELPYPKPHICQSDLTNVEFSLRRSSLACGLYVLQKFLPDKPVAQYIDSAVSVLRDLKLLEAAPSENLTNTGKLLSRIPDFGTLQMSLSVLAALREYNCGHDLICLSSILGVLNSTAIFSLVPPILKSSDGDFMTLLNIMNEILSVKKKISRQQFNIDRICEVANLTQIRHVIGPALRRYLNLEKSFNVSDYRVEASKESGQWESIAKALLAGYSDNVFISMRELYEKNLLYARYTDKQDIAVLDIKSTLTKPVKQKPVPLVVARDVFYSTAVRSRAIISFVGEIKLDWMYHSIRRELILTAEEEAYLNDKSRYDKVRQVYPNNIQMSLSNKTIKLTGRSDVVLNAELQLRKEMIKELSFSLENHHSPGTAKHQNLAANLEKVSKMPNIFHPMIWRWEAEKQVKITVDNNTSAKTCDIKVVGRPSEIAIVKEEFDSFLSWLSYCAVLRDPDAGVSPRVLQPKVREKCLDVEERIARITDIKKTRIDLFNATKGSSATRESRMEAVLWVAICKFDCKIEGGFVRDWVVGKYIQRPDPSIKPSDWIKYEGKEKVPTLIKEVVPGDLDCHLPRRIYFDIEKFKDELHKLGITCDVCRQSWRYILLLDKDEKTGPFTMDLIEPHIALTHDQIDLDVNNLYLEKGYTREIGMRVDIQELPYSISLESIVKNIQEKKFRVLRPVDKQLKERIEKMKNIRKWDQVGEPFPILPAPHLNVISVVAPLPSSSDLYQDLAAKMEVISDEIRIKSIEQIRNPRLEGLYEFMKANISGQCPQSNPKERCLFHGTNHDAVQGITDYGFDDRYFSSSGRWGHGAYFADDPRKSHGYTSVNPQNKTRVMFYAKVLLGVQSVQNEDDQNLNAAPLGHHSVQGTGGKYEEYIVYRYGQALPYLKITYKT